MKTMKKRKIRNCCHKIWITSAAKISSQQNKTKQSGTKRNETKKKCYTWNHCYTHSNWQFPRTLAQRIWLSRIWFCANHLILRRVFPPQKIYLLLSHLKHIDTWFSCSLSLHRAFSGCMQMERTRCCWKGTPEYTKAIENMSSALKSLEQLPKNEIDKWFELRRILGAVCCHAVLLKQNDKHFIGIINLIRGIVFLSLTGTSTHTHTRSHLIVFLKKVLCYYEEHHSPSSKWCDLKFRAHQQITINNCWKSVMLCHFTVCF